MSNVVRDMSDVADQAEPEKDLAQIVAEYSSPQFTEALLNHFHEAKRRALGDASLAQLEAKE